MLDMVAESSRSFGQVVFLCALNVWSNVSSRAGGKTGMLLSQEMGSVSKSGIFVATREQITSLVSNRDIYNRLSLA